MFKVNATRIRGLMFERGLSIEEFAKSAQINGLTARRAIQDGSTLSAKSISTLARFFGVDGNELIVTSNKEVA